MRTPAEIIDRAVGRPHAHHEVMRSLREERWHLIRASHISWDTPDDLYPHYGGRTDRITVELPLSDTLLSREIRTSALVLERALYSDLFAAERREWAWRDLALPLGQELGVLGP